MDSRWKTAPRVHFGYSKRSDVLKRANDLGSYLPKDYSHQAPNTVDINKLVSPMDARYKTPPAFTMGASERDDVIKQANPLGVPMPQLDQADRPVYCAPSSFEKAAAAARRGGCGHTMGASNREAVLKLYNPQNVPLPKDLSAQDDKTDFTKLVSPMDSRYKRPRSCTFGVGNREDVILRANSLGVFHPPHSRRVVELKKRQDEYFGRVSKGSSSSPRPATVGLGKTRRNKSNNDLEEEQHDNNGKDSHTKSRPSTTSTSKIHKARQTPKQKLMEEVRRENAKHRRKANKGKLDVLRRARKNSSSWIQHFQRMERKPV